MGSSTHSSGRPALQCTARPSRPRQHHDIGSRQGGAKSIEQAELGLGGRKSPLLFVRAQQLVAAGHEAGFDRGRPAGCAHQPIAEAPADGGGDPGSRRIVADQPDQHDLRDRTTLLLPRCLSVQLRSD